MTDTPQVSDLRTRMTRVAVKTARPHPAVTPRPPGRLAARRGLSPVRPGIGAPPIGQSRLTTLRAWGSWELATVPAHRWRWLTRFVLGQPPD